MKVKTLPLNVFMNQSFVRFIHLFKKLFGTKIRGFPKEHGSNLVCQAVLRKARMFNMTTDRQVILTQSCPGCCILEPFNYRIWIPEVNSRSKIRYSCNFVGVLYQLQVSSSQASRTNQAYLAVTCKCYELQPLLSAQVSEDH